MGQVIQLSPTGLGTAGWIMNAALVLVAVASMIAFSRPAVRGSSTWRATVTPLASIVGSGFLIVAPLLGSSVGPWALPAMAGIVGLAYLVGEALRYNILHVEDLEEGDEGSPSSFRGVMAWAARVAKAVLAMAYVVAVTFYLELLGAFVLRLFDAHGDVAQKMVATGLIVFIGGFGFWKGLKSLESLETWAVEIKLSVIAALLVGLVLHNGQLLLDGTWHLAADAPDWSTTTVRELLGSFLIVQGFETSRYLRGTYPPEVRVRTMRYAQWASAGIYLSFVGLATVLLGSFNGVSETGIIDLSAEIAFVLPLLLVFGAVMSQFSAAVADTIGSGGLASESTGGKVRDRVAYVGVAVLSLALLWTTDIFSVIAYASRGFALYYAIQCGMAAVHAYRAPDGTRRLGRAGLFAVLAVVMLITAAFGIPAESAG